MQLELLRERMHAAIDRVLDEIDAESESDDPPAGAHDLAILRGDDNGEWHFTWPNGDTEQYHTTRWYRLSDQAGSWRALVAWTRRSAWRKDRKRAIVFGETGSGAFYPWTEFVETDDDRYAASLPNPDRPRASLTFGQPLPARFRDLDVCRADELFDTISDGPSLRLVVREADEVTMVAHGHWVATLRGRI